MKNLDHRRRQTMISGRKKNIPHSLPPLQNHVSSLSVNPNDRQRLIPGSPAPHAMRQSAQQLQTDHATLWRKGVPQSPKISVSSAETDEEDDEEYSSQLDKLVEVKGVGVAVSHPALELEQNGRKPPNTPMPHLSANKHNGQMRPHRSLPSSSGSMSSASSNEGNNGGIGVGTRRPPTSLSVLSSQSLAEVTKTIRERHSSLDGGLSPPPRVVSLEDSRGFKVMTELVNHDNRSIGSPPEDEKRPTNLSSRYKPLKPISTKNVK